MYAEDHSTASTSAEPSSPGATGPTAWWPSLHLQRRQLRLHHDSHAICLRDAGEDEFLRGQQRLDRDHRPWFDRIVASDDSSGEPGAAGSIVTSGEGPYGMRPTSTPAFPTREAFHDRNRVGRHGGATAPRRFNSGSITRSGRAPGAWGGRKLQRTNSGHHHHERQRRVGMYARTVSTANETARSIVTTGPTRRHVASGRPRRTTRGPYPTSGDTSYGMWRRATPKRRTRHHEDARHGLPRHGRPRDLDRGINTGDITTYGTRPRDAASDHSQVPNLRRLHVTWGPSPTAWWRRTCRARTTRAR